jgi:hypothetical protein
MAVKDFPIFIDDTKFTVDQETVQGEYLRSLPPVPDDYDLWLRSNGPEDDPRIEPGQTYTIKPGEHFYTSKSEVGPGAL